jgi:hypothetical protein
MQAGDDAIYGYAAKAVKTGCRLICLLHKNRAPGDNSIESVRALSNKQ